MKHPKTIVIVTDSETARLFGFEGRNKPLIPMEKHTMNAPEVNAPSDVQGTTHSSVGHAQHRLAPRTGPDKAKDMFAAKIADYLDDSAKMGGFERLVLIASPRMMGLLRDRLSTAVQSKIWVQIDKNFGGLGTEKIGEALNQHLYS